MKKRFDLGGAALAILCSGLLLCASGFAEDAPAVAQESQAGVSRSNQLPDAPGPADDAITFRSLPKNFAKDQRAIWTSPAHIRVNDLNWLVPIAGITAGTLVTDRDAMKHVVTHNAHRNSQSLNASNAMLGVIAAVPMADLALGTFGDHEHARETGILALETAADSAVVEQGMKLMFWRERPNVDNGQGKFWQSSVGVDSSFPSSHTVFAWSLASLLASEYPSKLSQLTVYTLATGVSVTRVMGQEHFPSDVLVGSVTGWLIGHYVYKVRHRFQRDDY